MLGAASAQIDSGIWILPRTEVFFKWPPVSQKLDEFKKVEGEWAGQGDLSKKCKKREHGTKTVSVRFCTRIFAHQVRLPRGIWIHYSIFSNSEMEQVKMWQRRTVTTEMDTTPQLKLARER